MKHKGKIAVGYDADLVLVDMDLKIEIKNEDQQTKCGWSPWHGTTLQGWPVRTWVMGREVFRKQDGKDQFEQHVFGRAIEYSHPA